MSGPGPWRLVAALGVTQVVSWGSLYYAFAVVMPSLQEALGISRSAVVGAYSLSLLLSGVVAVPVGRHIDTRGSRVLMASGSFLAVVSLALLSQARSVAALYFAEALMGVAMGMTLYEPAFASLAIAFRENLRKAITVLTLAGGFASTVFWPLTQWLADAFGWREALLGLAAINLLLCVPLHAIFLPGGEHPALAANGKADPGQRARLLADPRFRWLAIAFTGNTFVFSTAGLHMLSILQDRGYSAPEAAALGALIGPMQVAGRVVDMVFADRLSPRHIGIFAMLALPASLAVLYFAGASMALVVAFAVLYGSGNGIVTIVRGTVPAELFGREGYGAMNGLIATPSLVARAAGPLLGAALLAPLGGYGGVILFLAAVALVAGGCFIAAVRK
jgi:predicted MFS family arabinose efflux permease